MPLVVQLYIHNARNIICAIALFLRACLQHRVLRVQLLSYLKMGTEKYASPGCDRPLGGAVQIGHAKKFYRFFRKLHVRVRLFCVLGDGIEGGE